jgi:hypothetical protein
MSVPKQVIWGELNSNFYEGIMFISFFKLSCQRFVKRSRKQGLTMYTTLTNIITIYEKCSFMDHAETPSRPTYEYSLNK